MSSQIIPLKSRTDFGIQPNFGHGDHSRLSCGAGDTQLGPAPASAVPGEFEPSLWIQHLLVERQVSYDLLQLAVLFLELTQSDRRNFLRQL